MARQSTSGDFSEGGESILRNPRGDGSSVEVKQTVEKICVSCGDDVSGRKRFKDSAGQYYCENCAPILDGKEPLKPPSTKTTCAECKQEVEKSSLVDFKGRAMCGNCAKNLEAAAKREHARILAAQAEAEEEEKRKKMTIVVSCIVGAIIVAFAVYKFAM